LFSSEAVHEALQHVALPMVRERQEPSSWCINAYRCIAYDFPPTSKY